jgi:hypothetical protein
MRKVWTVAAALALSLAASAQPFLGGTVYQLAPNGVYLNTPQGLTFVPNTGTSFQIGGASVNFPNLTVGRPVNVYYPQGWTPQYVPMDFYQQNPNMPWNQTVQTWQVEKVKWKKPKGNRGKAKGHYK